MYRFNFIIVILFILFFIFEAYQIYTTGILHSKYASFNLTENQKLFTSLFLILSSVFILYKLTSYKKDKKIKIVFSLL